MGQCGKAAICGVLVFLVVFAVSLPQAFADPLPTWRDGDAKAAITDFVTRVTDPGSEDFVPVDERVAVFDNDGTLWSEQPVYFQVIFAMDQVRDAAAKDPGFADTPALKEAVAGDWKALFADHGQPMGEVLNATHGEVSVEEFEESAGTWLREARHPDTDRPYDQMIYQPMLELLRYLRDEGFATYIVSGGGLHFIRAYADGTYGIPPQQVIGTTNKERFEVVEGVPELIKEEGVFFINDKGGKPVGIDRHIGRRPIFAAGNSDGDLEMLQWTTAGDGPRFGMIVHHDDPVREWAYDRDSKIGRLDKAMDLAPKEGWLLVSMKNDWAQIFPWGNR